MAFTPAQPFPPEVTVPGQEITTICFDLITDRNAEPFVAMIVSGPENALCVRLNAPTLGDMIQRLMELHTKMKKAR
jgi:hypothetical protein